MEQTSISSTQREGFSRPVRFALFILAGSVIIAGLYFLSRYNYLLFHGFAEGFSIVISFAIFAVAWNSRRFMTNDYLLFLGIAYLFIGVLDFLHTLAYRGMGVFSGFDTDPATQIWIATRYLQSLSLLAAPLLLHRKLKAGIAAAGYLLVSGTILCAIFWWDIFPRAFIEGTGLTTFKVASEYIISALLVLAGYALYRHRGDFDRTVYRSVLIAIIITIASEMTFTIYSDAYGVANMAGHLLKIVSFYFVYKALIESGLRRPYETLFRELKLSEEKLTQGNQRLEQEVIERENAENTARHNEARYRNLFSTMSEGFALHEMIYDDAGNPIDYRFLEVNPAFEKLTGLSGVVGKTARDVLEGLEPSWIETYGKVVNTGESVNFENYSAMLERWYAVRAYSPSPGTFVTLFSDITEKKKAENELQKTKTEWERTFNTVPDLIAILSPDQRIVRVNRAMAERLGTTPEQCIGLYCYEAIHGTDGPPDFCPHCMTRKDCQEHTAEVNEPRLEGDYLVTTTPLFDENGVLAGTVHVARDITEQKRVADQLRIQATVWENMSEAVIATDAAFRIIAWNRAATMLYGWTSEEAIGKNSWELLHQGLAREHIDRMIEALQKEGRVSCNHEHYNKHGRRLNIEARIVSRTDEHGQVTGYIATNRDVTEEYEAQRKLRESEMHFRMAMRDSPVSVAVQDLDMKYIWAYNHKSASPDEIVGHCDEDLFTPEEVAIINPMKRRVIEEDIELNTQMWFDRPGGKMYLAVYWEPIHDESGNVIGIGSTTLDMTATREAEEALRDSHERFQILSEANSLLLTAEEPERVIQTIAEKVMKHLDCDVFFNFILDTTSRRLKLNAYAGIPRKEAARIAWLDIGTAICGCVAQEGCRIVSEDVQGNSDERADLVRSFGVQAHACHPLIVGEETIGTLSFGTKSRTQFTQDELDLMKTVADQVSVAMIRKSARDALRASEREIRELVETANSIIIRWKKDGTITFVNNYGLRFFGYREEELIGKSVNILLPQRETSGRDLANLVEDIAANPQAYISLINDNALKDGSVVTVNWSNKAVYDEDGNLREILAIGNDITEQKRAEERLRQSEERYRELFTSMHEGFFLAELITERDTVTDIRFLEVNPAFERMLGVDRDEALDTTLTELMGSEGKKWLKAITRVFRSGEASLVDDRNPRSDRFLRSHYYIPRPGVVACILTDITEQKKAEEEISHLASFPELNPNPIMELDGNEQVVYMNPEARRVFPTLAREGLQHPFLTGFRAIERELREQRKMIVRRDIPVGELWYEQAVTFSPARQNFRIYSRDITARVQAEAVLKRSNTELEASNRELEAFSYSVSHDLRAPLRSMEGFSSALLEDYADKLDEQGKQYLDYVKDASDTMGQLIDGLLRLSRITRSEMNYQAVDLSALAQKIVETLERNQAGKPRTVTIQPGIMGFGDEQLLQVAMENLLSNAWKFTAKTADPKIEVGVLEENGRPVYYVRDNGAGFNMKYAGKLFQPFQRLHKTTEYEGTGIGLATVQRVVRRHGGTIRVESQEGEGTTFYFTLS